ncbi:hypothetical protein HOG21_01510 [bacterium]|jgi:hypothetical protein|nr:hypothetical protein [bacterium]
MKKFFVLWVTAFVTFSSSVLAVPPAVSDNGYGQPLVAESDRANTAGMSYVGASARITTIVTGMMGNAIKLRT